jgi:glycosyltransferase involved in cell wall biosynthesis
LITIRRNKDYKYVIVYAELFPFIPSLIETILLPKKYAYDFDDSMFLKYNLYNSLFISKLFKNKINSLIQNSNSVFAGNKYLYNHARNFNSNVYILPTVVDTNLFRNLNLVKEKNIFTIGWLGSPSTEKYLNIIINILEQLGKQYNIRLIVIGGKAPKINNISILEYKWSEDTEINYINQFDVGIMPLYDDEWTKGKCGFKLIQYMACEVPVIASSVGANFDVVPNDCGILVKTENEWKDAFLKLIADRDHRINLGLNARNWIINNYSKNKYASYFLNSIKINFI